MNSERPQAELQHSSTLDEIVHEEAGDWHFDPLNSAMDYRPLGNIRSSLGDYWETLTTFGHNLPDTVAGGSIVKCDSFGNAQISKNASRLVAVGYSEHNTSYFKAHSDEFEEVFRPVLEVSGLENPVGSILYQPPGAVIPWHYDTFTYYVTSFGVDDPRRVSRRLVFLEDWSWGHYMLIGNSSVHQWRAGDMVDWPYKMRHLSANAGLTPKLTMQLTGLIATR